jgi:Holliday junction DNA helicase RuvB
MASAWTHLGLAVPEGVFGQDTLDLFNDGADGGNDAEAVDAGR